MVSCSLVGGPGLDGGDDSGFRPGCQPRVKPLISLGFSGRVAAASGFSTGRCRSMLGWGGEYVRVCEYFCALSHRASHGCA